MRLLVTRPEPDAQETAAQLEALGHFVLVEPLSTIAFLSPLDLSMTPAAIVFTSRNGVRAAARWPMVADWFDLPVFTVGEKTGEAAREAGFTNVKAGTGDAAGLADTISGALDPNAGKVLYIAGRERAGDLEARLVANGFDVVTAEAYAAIAVPELGAEAHEALAVGAIDGALFFSRRAAAIFADLVKRAGLAGALRHVIFYAISDAAAEPLRRFDAAGMHVASHPDAESLIALVDR